MALPNPYDPNAPIPGLSMGIGQEGLQQRIQQGMPAPPTAPRTATPPTATPVDPGWSDVNEFQQTRPNVLQRAGNFIPIAGTAGDYEQAIRAQGLGQATKNVLGGLARRFINR